MLLNVTKNRIVTIMTLQVTRYFTILIVLFIILERTKKYFSKLHLLFNEKI